MNTLAHADHALQTPDAKRDYNRRLFRVVAPRYDLVTRLLSFGRDATWKLWLLSQLPAAGPRDILDLACGTGDLTRALALRYPDARVTGLDLTPEMLDHAAPAPRVQWLVGDMCATKLPDASQDLVTGGYALRNAPDLDAALAEIRRLLRPGGSAAFLDFSAPASPFLRSLNHALLLFWGGLWGLLLHGDPRVYAYIARSLARYPDRAALRQKLEAHQLHIHHSRRFMFGMIEVLLLQNQESV
jgi:demethylmenaquinone methyltransferase/2-methoxy-6-polyprenyl-1,4-benzoquinol methylase